ncbi:MAG: dTDP-glucose 4,6-dehydratase, partial [Parcubacteria group bacterium Gr01-1014_106]
MHILVTGGAGFIGSAFARLLTREHPEWTLVVYDKLSYAGNLQNLAEIAGRYQFVRGDIVDEEHVAWVLDHFSIDAVVNFAAESHVDRSILSGRGFAITDVVGAHTLIEQSRAHGIARFLQVSTDEVYGSIQEGHWTEESPLQPNSPYSASKAGGDLQVRAAFRTYGFPALITRGSNTY